MLKFAVGDKVRVIQGWDEINGYTGVVTIALEGAWMPYNVTMDSLPEDFEDMSLENWLMAEDELELLNEG